MASTDPEPPPPPPPSTRTGVRPEDLDDLDGPRTLRGKGRPGAVGAKRASLTLEALAPLSTEEGAAMDARARALRAESRVIKRPQRAPDEPAVSRVLERPQGLAAGPALSRVLERPETGLAASPEPRTLPPRIVSPSEAAGAPEKPVQTPKKGPKSRSGPRPKGASAADPANREALAIQMRIEGSGKRGGVAVEPPPVEEGDEWAVSFVDVFTLLLTLFIMLMSRMQLKTDAIDPEGVAKTEAALVAAEKQVAVFEKEIVKLKKKVGDPPPFEFPVGQLGNDVQVTRVKGGIQLAISDKILFTPGSAKLKPEGLDVLDSLLRLLMSGRFPITVEGHTDNMPIGTAMFPSNWELSAARASSVVRHLIAQGISDRRLKAVGYADTQPVTGNDTLEGRARNRRVSLTLIQE
jgi:chemotaxis protein MotB